MSIKSLKNGTPVQWIDDLGPQLNYGKIVENNGDGTVCVEVTDSIIHFKGDLVEVPVKDLIDGKQNIYMYWNGSNKVKGSRMNAGWLKTGEVELTDRMTINDGFKKLLEKLCH